MGMGTGKDISKKAQGWHGHGQGNGLKKAQIGHGYGQGNLKKGTRLARV